MAQQTLWAKIKEWIGGVGFAIYLWSQTLTAEEYFDLLESDAEQRRGAGADKQTCPFCYGRGFSAIGVYREDCEACHGTGQV